MGPATGAEDKIVKTVIAGAIGLSLLAGFASPADAGARAKKHKDYAKQDGQYSTYRRVQDGDTYYEHLADKLPIGSSIWWDQMVRERRGGRSG